MRFTVMAILCALMLACTSSPAEKAAVDKAPAREKMSTAQVAAELQAQLEQLGYFKQPSVEILGVDVSHHQGKIDWKKVKAAGYEFAYIKATEGGDWVDDRFAANARDAKKAGLAVGAYHFFTFCRPGLDQAANFTRVVAPSVVDLPPAVDIELVGNCKKVPDREGLSKELDPFLAEVEKTFSARPVLYLAGEAYVRFVEGAHDDNPIWIRSIGERPSLSDGRSWTLWQRDDSGSVDGIKGPVDINVFEGTAEGFRELAGGD